MFKKFAGVLLLFFCLIIGLSIVASIFNWVLVENEFSKNDTPYNLGVIIGRIIADIILFYLLYRLTKFSIKLISNKKPMLSEIDDIGQHEIEK